MTRYARKRQIRLVAIITICVIVLVLTQSVLANYWKLPALIFLLLYVIIGIISAILYFSLNQLTHYSQGDRGEKNVAHILKTIPNITVFKDICLPDTNWNIDHVVVSSSGVFVLETKNYEGNLQSRGDDWFRVSELGRQPIRSFSRQARGNAFQLRNYLISKLTNPAKEKLFITPLVVLAAPFDPHEIRTPNVLSISALKAFFTSETQTYGDILREVKNILEDLTTV